jgi:hypothetical protein
MKPFTLFVAIFLFFMLNLNAQIKETRTDWNNIKNSDGIIKLTEVKVWGKDMNNVNEAFNYPKDIGMDNKGNYYIVDAGKNQISIFDKEYHFINKIGKYGHGPGDLNYPESIKIDLNNNIIVSEGFNNRVQVFLNNNKHSFLYPTSVSFTKVEVDNNKRIILSREYNTKKRVKLFIYDYNEKFLGNIGVFKEPIDRYGIPDYTEYPFDYCIDNEGCIYISNMRGYPVIEKHSPDGNIIMKISYSLQSVPKEKSGKEAVAGARGICVDKNGNIYLIALKKNLSPKEVDYFPTERMAGRTRSNGNTSGMTSELLAPQKAKSSFDFYQLIVFDKNGNLKGSKSLNYLASNIRTYNGYLFILDIGEMTFHQYKIN